MTMKDRIFERDPEHERVIKGWVDQATADGERALHICIDDLLWGIFIASRHAEKIRRGKLEYADDVPGSGECIEVRSGSVADCP